MKVSGIEWDDGNIDHCQKHGVSRDDIEHVLRTMTFRIADPNPTEPRFRTAARSLEGRPVFLVYMHRKRDGGTWLRPISARYMHEKEIKHYEQIEKKMANPANR